jgi:carbon storage regulator
MLVLSRKCGERIVIGSNIEIVVVCVRGDRVRLGFQAPIDVPIHRAEVHDRIQTEMATNIVNDAR